LSAFRENSTLPLASSITIDAYLPALAGVAIKQKVAIVNAVTVITSEGFMVPDSRRYDSTKREQPIISAAVPSSQWLAGWGDCVIGGGLAGLNRAINACPITN